MNEIPHATLQDLTIDLQIENEQLAARVATLESAIAYVDGHNPVTVVAELQAKIKELEAELEAQSAEFEQEYETRARKGDAYLARQDARIAELEAQLAARSSELMHMTQTAVDAEGRITELEADTLNTAELLTQMSSVQMRLHEAEARLAARQWMRITDDESTWPPSDDSNYLTVTWNPYGQCIDEEINKGTFLHEAYASPEMAEIDWQAEPEYWLRLPSYPITPPEPEP